MTPPRTAAALIIGNELLTGKIQDANVSHLARELFELGIALRRVVVCPDEVEIIVEDLNDLRRRHDYVFTSGGVGPTHDDVTLEAAARAFGRELVRCERLERLLTGFFGERSSRHHLRMARVPEGTELVTDGKRRWPTLRLENVFILPGLPQAFRRKMPLLRELLVGGEPFVSRSVETTTDEWELAPVLERLASEHPEVAIGSYPRWGESPRVTVTFDGRDGEEVERALGELLAHLPPERVRESLAEE